MPIKKDLSTSLRSAQEDRKDKEKKKYKHCYNSLSARNLEIPHQVRNDEGIVRTVKQKHPVVSQ